MRKHEGICTREPGLYFEQEGTQEGVRLLLRAYLLRSIRTAVSLAGIKQMQTECTKQPIFKPCWKTNHFTFQRGK